MLQATQDPLPYIRQPLREIFVANYTGVVFAIEVALFRAEPANKETGASMQAERSLVSLIYRTIGAARGRAARGRPT